MAYTGVFLVGNLAVPLWNTWTIAAVFTCSSLSGGVSLLLLADYFIKDQTLLLRAVRPLQKCHLVCLAAEAASIALFMGVAFGNPAAQSSLDLLLSPDMLATAVVGALGCGLVAPALWKRIRSRARSAGPSPCPTSCACSAGCACATA